MSSKHPTKCPGDKVKLALTELSVLLRKNPGKSRKALLQQVEIQFDLTPKECEFLNKNFQDQ